ncbi:MAG: hypothetical protein AVDCRST_MAG93-1026, partial [uncultured Chloroflexia bacterium]
TCAGCSGSAGNCRRRTRSSWLPGASAARIGKGTVSGSL